MNVCVCYYDVYWLQCPTDGFHRDAGHYYHQTYFYVLSALYAFPWNAFSCVSGVCDVWSLVCHRRQIHFLLFDVLSGSKFVVRFHHLTMKMNLTLDGRHLSHAFLCSGLLCLCLQFTQDIIVIDRVAGEIIRLAASVCVCVNPVSVGALPFEPFDLDV